MLSRAAIKSISTTASLQSLRYLSPSQVRSYESDGFLVVRKALSPQISSRLQQMASELESWPEAPGKWMKYYEIDRKTGRRLLCRVENFLPYMPELSEVAFGLITDISSDLFGEDAVIYKEKINFKFPNGSGFNAHQDQPAFVSFGISKLLTVLLPIDPNTRESGGLDMVKKQHLKREIFPQNEDGSIQTGIEAKMNWVPVDGEAGDLIFFDSYVPHRSDINVSNFTRRNLYLTYNPVALGSFRKMYYEEKRRAFPPECERDPNKDYSQGAKVFNVANPIK